MVMCCVWSGEEKFGYKFISLLVSAQVRTVLAAVDTILKWWNESRTREERKEEKKRDNFIKANLFSDSTSLFFGSPNVLKIQFFSLFVVVEVDV